MPWVAELHLLSLYTNVCHLYLWHVNLYIQIPVSLALHRSVAWECLTCDIACLSERHLWSRLQYTGGLGEHVNQSAANLPGFAGPDNKTQSGCWTKAASHAYGNGILQMFSLEVSSRFNGEMKEWSNSEQEMEAVLSVLRLTCYLVVHLSCNHRRKVNGVSWQQCLV